MFKKYYQEELTFLKELSKEFSKAHPAIAPYLQSESSDPDVERLLEGVAFMTGMLRKKIDDELPEVIHGLMDVVFPHYLRPVPAVTMMQFYPTSSMNNKTIIPKNTPVSSIKINEQNAIFKTCFDIKANLIEIKNAEYIYNPGEKAKIKIDISLKGIKIENLDSDSLVFYVNGNYNKSSNIFKTILTETSNIKITSNENEYSFGIENISLPGFERKNNLLPYPLRSFTGYMFIQEYFIFPQKFLFFKLNGFDKWKNRGNADNFTINFELFEHNNELPEINTDTFKLFCSPAINLFEVEGEPITLDHKKNSYRVISPKEGNNHYNIHSVSKVKSFIPKTGEHKTYYPFEIFKEEEKNTGIFKENRTLSPINNEIQISISILYNNNEELQKEVLTPNLLCTNGNLPTKLQLGDINKHLTKSPSNLDFKNITNITNALKAPLHKESLWRFLSHISINLLSVADSNTIKELLKLYIYDTESGSTSTIANTKRIEGISSLKITKENRLFKGQLINGFVVEMKAKSQNFASIGDLYIFGSIMNIFFTAYSSINSFVRFILIDEFSGERFEWKSKKGERPLL